MNKPIIFFSHSSADKLILKKLKEKFESKTGSTIEIFLSSDGQSIPLGRNWVHKIQESLNKAKVMIVFLTPNSIKSNWVYFESGFAYSKNIRVVPVGFLGIDLNLIAPPLSLLQGFNITSEEGFNNLIAIINKEFEYKHGLSFSNEDYNSVVALSSLDTKNTFGEGTSFIENIEIKLEKNKDFNEEQSKVYDDLTKYLTKHVLNCQLGEDAINFYGVSIYKSSGHFPEEIIFRIDPLIADENLPILFEAIKNIRNEGIKRLSIRFDFQKIIDRLKHIHKVTARFYKTEIKLGVNREFTFRDFNFFIENLMYFAASNIRRAEVYIKIILREDKICLSDIKDLFDLLIAREIIFINQDATYEDL